MEILEILEILALLENLVNQGYKVQRVTLESLDLRDAKEHPDQQGTRVRKETVALQENLGHRVNLDHVEQLDLLEFLDRKVASSLVIIVIWQLFLLSEATATVPFLLQVQKESQEEDLLNSVSATSDNFMIPQLT